MKKQGISEEMKPAKKSNGNARKEKHGDWAERISLTGSLLDSTEVRKFSGSLKIGHTKWKWKRKKKGKKRVSEGCGTISNDLTNMPLQSQKEKKEWDRSIWRCNGQKFSKNNEWYQTTDPRSSDNLSERVNSTKQNKDTCGYIILKPLKTKVKEKVLSTPEEKQTHYIQRNQDKQSQPISHQKIYKPEDNVLTSLKCF